MMIGEINQSNQTVLVPPWNFPDDASYGGGGGGMSFSLSPNSNANANFNVDDFPLYLQNEALTALQRYLPSNDVGLDLDGDGGGGGGDMDLPLDAYSNDSFRMFEFKVRKCTRSRSHDWTDCPFAHPGEKARRRDPRKFHYSGTACPDFRKGYCKRGDSCEYAHGVFECWLHPSRYRTQPCKDGVSCTRRVCFFAHTPEQLRILSPRNHGSAELFDSPPSDSPPMSPISNSLSHSLGSASVSEMNHMISSLRQLQLNKVKSMPKSWGLGLGLGTSPPGYGSPRFSMIRPEFSSLPSTPTRSVTRPGLGFKDIFEDDVYEEEPVMERVESGKGLRARMFEKLSKENPLDRDDPNQYDQYLYSNPDIDWISDLVNQS